MLLDTPSFKSCIKLSDNHKACAMLHHSNIPDKAHKKNLAITLHTDNIFHERYFHFFSFFFFPPKNITQKSQSWEKTSFNPSHNSDVTAVSHELWIAYCILYCRLGVPAVLPAPAQDSHGINQWHHEATTVACCQSCTENNRGEKKLHPSGLQFPQVTFFSKSKLWTCSWSLHTEMFKFWLFPPEILNIT